MSICSQDSLTQSWQNGIILNVQWIMMEMSTLTRVHHLAFTPSLIIHHFANHRMELLIKTSHKITGKTGKLSKLKALLSALSLINAPSHVLQRELSRLSTQKKTSNSTMVVVLTSQVLITSMLALTCSSKVGNTGMDLSSLQVPQWHKLVELWLSQWQLFPSSDLN